MAKHLDIIRNAPVLGAHWAQFKEQGILYQEHKAGSPNGPAFVLAVEGYHLSNYSNIERLTRHLTLLQVDAGIDARAASGEVKKTADYKDSVINQIKEIANGALYALLDPKEDVKAPVENYHWEELEIQGIKYREHYLDKELIPGFALIVRGYTLNTYACIGQLISDLHDLQIRLVIDRHIRLRSDKIEE